jgi:hypothetical protein
MQRVANYARQFGAARGAWLDDDGETSNAYAATTR